MAKRKNTLMNVGIARSGARVLYLSVQPPRNGGFVSLWDEPERGDGGDVCVELELTEEQYKLLEAASRATVGGGLS